MEYVFQYNDETERNSLLETNKDKYLIAEKNITEGNFLIFTDVKPIEIGMKELEQRTTATEDALLTLLMTV